MNIKNKSVIVTGAGSGIGRETAISFAKGGARVAVVGRRAEKLAETKKIIEDLGAWCIDLPGDITQEHDTDEIIAETIYQFGKIDILVNNAGSFNTIGPIWETDTESWWKDVTINILGTYLITKKALEDMMKFKEGIIVFMNGGGAGFPLPGGSGYGIGKAGVLRLSDTLYKELQSVNCPIMTFAMGPGLVETEMTHIQSDTEIGRKWLGGTKEYFDKGLDTPASACGKKMIEIIENMRPELSGRIYDVNTDVQALLEDIDSIVKEDRYTLRQR
ncbi:MAG: SDR family oxidoreductase [Armatimonadetes bacterium]|nr:SDR family oxidoreductase [Candidatus Hippobium faecium]